MTAEEKSLYKHIGENIKRLREAENISQKALAQQCGLQSSNLCRLEQGRVNPTISTLYIVAKALNIKLSEIVND